MSTNLKTNPVVVPTVAPTLPDAAGNADPVSSTPSAPTTQSASLLAMGSQAGEMSFIMSSIVNGYSSMVESTKDLELLQLKNSYKAMLSSRTATEDAGHHQMWSYISGALGSFTSATVGVVQLAYTSLSTEGSTAKKAHDEAADKEAGLKQLQNAVAAGAHAGNAPRAANVAVHATEIARLANSNQFEAAATYIKTNHVSDEDIQAASATFGATARDQLSRETTAATQNTANKRADLEDFNRRMNGFFEIVKGFSKGGSELGQGIFAEKKATDDSAAIAAQASQKTVDNSVDALKQQLEAYYSKISSTLNAQVHIQTSGRA